ncbi:hypothetical protein GOBAR_AA09386 [Gossypium barbadense]|uniref:Myb/SANT-like DNA-binding domain-containing protein n=1 Tax=Gossypium barbadense TaxID=3634 RepID=A0A2P5Y6N2_GOSBA|nr:hypothetical protein GOBAR_AA09386 [Gossypium barbadense]
MQNSDQPVTMIDYNKMEIGKCSVSDEDEPSFAEEGVDGHNDGNKGKKGSPWQRVKWTDKMVRLLITAVSYIGEDMAGDCGGGMRRKFAVLQKKGKWKSVSKVIAERGYHVSPQQCEDKFNDLNKRGMIPGGSSFGGLDLQGSMMGTSCQVVENPALLDVIDYLTEKEKDDVRKILSSKHLFYEEMCSYHNGNRLHLPHDLKLQRSLQLALRRRDENENDDDCNKSSFSCPPVTQADTNQVLPDYSRAAWLQKQWIESRSLQQEEQKLQIQVEMLELEKQRFKWQRFSKKSDRELEKIRMENERMKLENEQMALELKRKGAKALMQNYFVVASASLAIFSMVALCSSPLFSNAEFGPAVATGSVSASQQLRLQHLQLQQPHANFSFDILNPSRNTWDEFIKEWRDSWKISPQEESLTPSVITRWQRRSVE